MNKRSVSVVIPNYNGKQLLEQNLPSVYEALKHDVPDYEIIVIDDCSSDDSISFLKEWYPEIKLIVNAKNQGFSPTINKGILSAEKDLIFILNNDVKLTAAYFSPQFRYFDREDTFGVMGKIIGTGGETQDTAKFPECKGMKIKGSTNYELAEASTGEEWLPSFMLSGANALIDRRKIQLLGGFNEIYAPFYWEDVDLSIRAWRLGWKCYYEAQSVCIHPTSTTIGKFFKKKQVSIISDRNKFILHCIHLTDKLRRMYRLKLFFKFLGCAVIFRISFLKSYLAFFKMRSAVRKEKIRFDELMKSQNSKITLQDIHEEITNQLKDRNIKLF